MNTIELITFRIGQQSFGADVASILHIFKLSSEIDTKYFERNNIPVINISDHSTTSIISNDEERRVIIVKKNGEKTGILVDNIMEIFITTINNIRILPSFITGISRWDCLWGVINLKGKLLLLLDLRKIKKGGKK